MTEFQLVNVLGRIARGAKHPWPEKRWGSLVKCRLQFNAAALFNTIKFAGVFPVFVVQQKVAGRSPTPRQQRIWSIGPHFLQNIYTGYTQKRLCNVNFGEVIKKCTDVM